MCAVFNIHNEATASPAFVASHQLGSACYAKQAIQRDANGLSYAYFRQSYYSKRMLRLFFVRDSPRDDANSLINAYLSQYDEEMLYDETSVL